MHAAGTPPCAGMCLALPASVEPLACVQQAHRPVHDHNTRRATLATVAASPLFRCAPAPYALIWSLSGSLTGRVHLQTSRRLALEWQAWVVRAHALRRVFVSVKGFYFQAHVMGQPVTWLVPHALSQVRPGCGGDPFASCALLALL